MTDVQRTVLAAIANGAAELARLAWPQLGPAGALVAAAWWVHEHGWVAPGSAGTGYNWAETGLLHQPGELPSTSADHISHQYDSLDDGIQATVATLRLPRYAAACELDDPIAVISAISFAGWGPTGGEAEYAREWTELYGEIRALSRSQATATTPAPRIPIHQVAAAPAPATAAVLPVHQLAGPAPASKEITMGLWNTIVRGIEAAGSDIEKGAESVVHATEGEIVKLWNSDARKNLESMGIDEVVNAIEACIPAQYRPLVDSLLVQLERKIDGQLGLPVPGTAAPAKAAAAPAKP